MYSVCRDVYHSQWVMFIDSRILNKNSSSLKLFTIYYCYVTTAIAANTYPIRHFKTNSTSAQCIWSSSHLTSWFVACPVPSLILYYTVTQSHSLATITLSGRKLEYYKINRIGFGIQYWIGKESWSRVRHGLKLNGEPKNVLTNSSNNNNNHYAYLAISLNVSTHSLIIIGNRYQCAMISYIAELFAIIDSELINHIKCKFSSQVSSIRQI